MDHLIVCTCFIFAMFTFLCKFTHIVPIETDLNDKSAMALSLCDDFRKAATSVNGARCAVELWTRQCSRANFQLIFFFYLPRIFSDRTTKFIYAKIIDLINSRCDWIRLNAFSDANFLNKNVAQNKTLNCNFKLHNNLIEFVSLH